MAKKLLVRRGILRGPRRTAALALITFAEPRLAALDAS
jgi:hypothetical protein